jgi:hypothetical protein
VSAFATRGRTARQASMCPTAGDSSESIAVPIAASAASTNVDPETSAPLTPAGRARLEGFDPTDQRSWCDYRLTLFCGAALAREVSVAPTPHVIALGRSQAKTGLPRGGYASWPGAERSFAASPQAVDSPLALRAAGAAERRRDTARVRTRDEHDDERAEQQRVPCHPPDLIGMPLSIDEREYGWGAVEQRDGPGWHDRLQSS